MKIVKNIAIVAFAASFMFAGIGFHMGNNYGNMDDGTTVAQSWGATFDLNESTSVGYDSELGMMFAFDAPAGVSFRMGLDATNGGFDDNPGTSIGLGYTWWTGGTGLKTSISTAYDMVSPVGGGDSEGSLSVTVGFGF